MCHLKEHYALGFGRKGPTLSGSSDYTKVALPQHPQNDLDVPLIAPCW